MDYADNPQLQLAQSFIQYTNRNVFLTGKAGTGKTTFLKRLKTLSPKRMVVLAPTGVAAINAGGLGTLLFDGLRTMNTVKILWGSLLSAALAVLANGVLKWAERRSFK